MQGTQSSSPVKPPGGHRTGALTGMLVSINPHFVVANDEGHGHEGQSAIGGEARDCGRGSQQRKVKRNNLSIGRRQWISTVAPAGFRV
jgi:hypothetical protein